MTDWTRKSSARLAFYLNIRAGFHKSCEESVSQHPGDTRFTKTRDANLKAMSAIIDELKRRSDANANA